MEISFSYAKELTSKVFLFPFSFWAKWSIVNSKLKLGQFYSFFYFFYKLGQFYHLVPNIFILLLLWHIKILCLFYFGQGWSVTSPVLLCLIIFIIYFSFKFNVFSLIFIFYLIYLINEIY